MRVSWPVRADRDLEQVFDYVLEQNPGAARRVQHAIHDQVDRLGEFPGLGRPGRVPNTRELMIARSPYIAAYEVDRRAGRSPSSGYCTARRWPEQL